MIIIPIVLYFQGDDIYIKNQNIVFGELIAEIIGLIGLINHNINYNKKKNKNLITGILVLLFIISSFVLYTLFSLRHGIGF